MAKRFTRNIRSIEDIEKQPKYTNQQNDLLSDDKHVYVRNKDQYEQITGGVKEVNGKEPDEQGNIEVDTGVMQVNGKDPDEQGNIELDYSDRNLLKGTSDEWKIYTWDKSYGAEYSRYEIDELGLQPGDQIVFSKELDNRLDDNEIPVGVTIQFRDKNNKVIEDIRTNKIKFGQCGAVEVKGKIIKGTKEILVFKANKEDNVNKKKAAGRRDKLQKGAYATDWTPNPSEIVTQDQYDKLAKAITNLGGSI